MMGTGQLTAITIAVPVHRWQWAIGTGTGCTWRFRSICLIRCVIVTAAIGWFDWNAVIVVVRIICVECQRDTVAFTNALQRSDTSFGAYRRRRTSIAWFIGHTKSCCNCTKQTRTKKTLSKSTSNVDKINWRMSTKRSTTKFIPFFFFLRFVTSN